MPIEVLMPALSPTMTEGKLAKWLIKEGDEVRAGDVLAEIETDKATMEVEAVEEGKVGRLLVEEGAEGVAVNTPIALLLDDDETADDAAPSVSPAESRQENGSTEAEADHAEGSVEEEAVDEAGGEEGVSRDAPARKPDAPAAPRTVRPDPENEAAFADAVTLTVREALRDAMAEEMRRDETVFVMGEEVGEYQGAYKITQGLLDEFGAKRVVDTPITEHGFAGLGVGAAFGGLKP